MTFLLDTNACIGYLNGSAPSIRSNLAKHRPGEVMLCAVVKAELLYGASKSQVGEATRLKLELFFRGFTSAPFDDVAAAAYGGIRAELERQGTPIGPNDLMIAAIALTNKATLVTHNTRESERIAGLALVDWE